MSVVTGLLVLAIAEVLALVAVAERIGPLDAIGLLLIVSAFGPALMRRSGAGGVRAAYSAMRGGPADRRGSDALLKLIGGLLVCVPGYLTDVAGLALWLPPIRVLVRRRLSRRYAGLLVDQYGGPAAPGVPDGRRRSRRGPVVEAGSHPLDPDPGDGRSRP